jgi:hypothetical protein
VYESERVLAKRKRELSVSNVVLSITLYFLKSFSELLRFLAYLTLDSLVGFIPARIVLGVSVPIIIPILVVLVHASLGFVPDSFRFLKSMKLQLPQLRESMNRQWRGMMKNWKGMTFEHKVLFLLLFLSKKVAKIAIIFCIWSPLVLIAWVITLTTGDSFFFNFVFALCLAVSVALGSVVKISNGSKNIL